MSKQNYWFKAKKYGWGWYPASWQGWLVLVLFLLMYSFATYVFVQQLEYEGSYDMQLYGQVQVMTIVMWLIQLLTVNIVLIGTLIYLSKKKGEDPGPFKLWK